MNTIKFISCFCLIVLITMSCTDNLTKTPLDSPSDATFYSSQSDLELAINGVYNSTWWHIRSLPALQEIDNATDIGFLRDGPMQPLQLGQHTADENVIRDTWSHLYRGISRANNLLENMHRAEEVVSVEFFNQTEAEAKFLRAFFYHYLIELYGDVPLLTEVPKVEEAFISRSSKDEVIDQIYSDLDFAAQYLPLSWSANNEGKATKGAALSLKARVALYNGDYVIASDSAEEVITSSEYALHPNYEELFKYAGIRSSEVIFDVPYSEGYQVTNLAYRLGDRMYGTWATNVPSQALIDSYQTIDGLHIDESPLYDPANPFKNRDPRLDASIIRPQSSFAGFIYETHPDSLETLNIDSNQRVENLNVTNPFASFTGYNFRKYLDAEDFPDSFDKSEINWIYIRLAEVLLIYAEAKIENNDIDQSVLDALNSVRARAYGVELSETHLYPAITTVDRDELRREVRYERKIELAMEGFRLFDIRRWGIADKVMNGTLIGRPIDSYETIPAAPSIDRDTGHHPDYSAYQELYRNVEERSFDASRDWLWPIPQDEINVNENMVQNPGY